MSLVLSLKCAIRTSSLRDHEMFSASLALLLFRLFGHAENDESRTFHARVMFAFSSQTLARLVFVLSQFRKLIFTDLLTC